VNLTFLPAKSRCRPASFADYAKDARTIHEILAPAEKFRELCRTASATPGPPKYDAMALVQTNPDAYTIKPEASAPAIDTSDWPLLLKNYSDCMQPWDIASERRAC
jgi:hypothetical protein